MPEDAPSGRIPLLVVTPFHRIALRFFAENGSHLQADDYVEKPLEPSALVEKVERLLSKQPEMHYKSVEQLAGTSAGHEALPPQNLPC